MLWFWFFVALAALVGLGAAWMLRHGLRVKRAADRFSMDGEGWLIIGGLAGLIALVLVVIIAGNAVNRHVSRQVCEKRDRVSSSDYTWVDFHFFNYECLLVTPSGNITETPVLPIENVGGQR